MNGVRVELERQSLEERDIVCNQLHDMHGYEIPGSLMTMPTAGEGEGDDAPLRWRSHSCV